MEDTPFNLYDKIIAELYHEVLNFIDGEDIVVQYDDTIESKFFFRIVVTIAALKQKTVYVAPKSLLSSLWYMKQIKEEYPNNNIRFAGFRAFNGKVLNYLNILCNTFGKYEQNISIIKDINQLYYGG